MRAALVLTAALALCATPVAAQGKTKGTTAAGVAAQALEALETCERFARGDVLAVDGAIEDGWDAYEETGESPYVRSYGGTKDFPGIGTASIFGLVEEYPQASFGYCRIDVTEPTGEHGAAAVEAIAKLPRYEGATQATDAGDFASLAGAEDPDSTLLLTHWTADAFVIQLTIVTPRPEGGQT
jgi:mannose-1-phosphate guanylyltransferase